MEDRKKIIALGWAVAILSLMVVAAAIAFGVLFGSPKSETVANANMLEASYSRAYYGLTAELNDMGVNLKKIDAISSAKKQQEMLYEVWASSLGAGDDLAALSVDGEGGTKLKRFINQTGDYAKYLAKKNVSLSEEEKQNLVRLSDMLEKVAIELKSIEDEINSGKAFLGDDGVVATVLPTVFDTFN